MKKIFFYTIIGVSTILETLMAQANWTVLPEEAKIISPMLFNEDMKLEGMKTFEKSCASCHGTPEMGNFAKLLPSPGDPANVLFQSQTDGSLFYKIRKGRAVMPSFENLLSEEETWNIIAYIRSFNKNYIQIAPISTGEKVQQLLAKMSYDKNINTLVIKVLVDSLPEEGIKVNAFVKAKFGNYALPKATTNKLGIAYIPVDYDLPADSLGNLIFLAKINKKLSNIKITDTLQVGEPNIIPSIIEGRHLWSTSKNAPIWLKFVFWGTIIIIWGTILYIVIGILGLKKIKK